MTESDFISNIDCDFPYASSLKWRKILKSSVSFSANATFMVLHELCRPPKSAASSSFQRTVIRQHLYKYFRHPLKSKLEKIISSQINGETVSVAVAAKAMRCVAAYPNQYNALAICYFSCNDKSNYIEKLYEGIIEKWQHA
jgi:hypothetical protein